MTDGEVLQTNGFLTDRVKQTYNTIVSVLNLADLGNSETYGVLYGFIKSGRLLDKNSADPADDKYAQRVADTLAELSVQNYKTKQKNKEQAK